ncbi:MULTISPECIES: hypothetical protein [Polymorphospora]|uniref:DUF4126 domain-containing protein n=1 Tax=Polymorphospora lycopeni TaxID=3140240 RepID=A0ABV5D0D4_9ACTN
MRRTRPVAGPARRIRTHGRHISGGHLRRDGHRRRNGHRAGAGTAWRAVVLGAATGGRSMTGLAGITLSARPPVARPLRILATLAAAGELAADKSPRTPSRLAPAPLAGRLATGAVAATALARRDGTRPLLPVLLACAGVVAASMVGVRFRAYASRRGHPTLAALAEDLVTVGLATTAVRHTGPARFAALRR